MRREIDFHIDLYPAQISEPFILKGLYRDKQKTLDLNCKIASNLFRKKQTIIGKAHIVINPEEQSDLDFNLNSSDINIQGSLYLKNNDLHIE